MPGSGPCFLNLQYLAHLLEQLALKISALVTMDDFGDSKSCEKFTDYLLRNCLRPVVRHRVRFRPLGEVVRDDDDIFVALG